MEECSIWEGLMEASIHFLKSARLSELLTLESELFYSVITEENKEFLN